MQLYPPPAYVRTATRSLNEQRLMQHRVDMQKQDARPIECWQEFKETISGQMRELRKAAKARMANGYRQRIQRKKASLARCQLGDGVDGRRNALLEALQEAQEQRRALKRRSLMARTTWSADTTTKQFYKRICTKFGDNTIRTLTPTHTGRARAQHDKANVLRDNWEEIFNGEAEDKGSMKAYVAKHQKRWPEVDLTEMDNKITEEEVQAAVAACKLGKACGPDGLGNDWYKDHSAQLVPILTQLFNECMTQGHTPSSFLEAYIFSISKGGDHSNPLNYRPIALLNSDYKIFTRIMAWRLRVFVDRLVNRRQYGFVPGRTIHEVRDLLETAQEVCTKNGELSQAQVLLLDFAKAYDSLDRDYLMEVLAAKGIPPRTLAIIRAIHTQTTVRFMANGFISEPLSVSVTSGIRQGCPLAPLLFVIAVDLLYDTIETEEELQGIALEPRRKIAELWAAGYADDTAIYIAHRSMQQVAIAAVQRFSAVSGLRLNVKKSVAINLARTDSKDDKEGVEQERNGEDTTEEDGVAVKANSTTRYLGHIVGGTTNVSEAWEKAFATLKIRLALAETKTNTAQQRAQIAAAIIVPKLTYVARHAWPPKETVKQADRCIRNYVWRAVFQDPDRTAAGWIAAGLAEQPVLAGGLGIPNIYKELQALIAMVVGEWGLSTDPQRQVIGDILQRRDGEQTTHLFPQEGRPRQGIRSTLWATGRPWAELHFHEQNAPPGDDTEEKRRIRAMLRHSAGVTTRWTNEGLEVQCTGPAREALLRSKRQRREVAGECMVQAVHGRRLKQLWIATASGEEWKAAEVARWYTDAANTTVGQVMDIAGEESGIIRCRPVSVSMPMTSGDAHRFRELCLSILANFPELVGRQPETSTLLVDHELDDKHHTFEVEDMDDGHIQHTWGAERKRVSWRPITERVTQAVADFLEVKETTVVVTPHPWLTRMWPMWVGSRRWTQTRKQYKRLINRRHEDDRSRARIKIQSKWREQHEGMAKALEGLEWSRIYRMAGVTSYQTQNIFKLKLNRLRLWAGDETGYKCQALQCGERHLGGPAHLAWACPEAQQFWRELRRQWASADQGGIAGSDGGVEEVFGFRLKNMPQWLVEWGQQQKMKQWEVLQKTADEMWAVGVAVMLTAIWRRNVDRLHPDDRKERGIAEAVRAGGAAVNEAYRRYKLGLLPWTIATAPKLRVAEAIADKCRRAEAGGGQDAEEQGTRIGYFDGGSRGNPGPGGSGSVIVQVDDGQISPTSIWVAVTALGSRAMTKNVAEFVGLHRLLEHAAVKGWRRIHVVGDSAMILRLMRTRTPPKAKRLKFWYQASIRLADVCRVESWTHHYRKHNKMADWLANQAMDNCRSEMLSLTEETKTHRLYQGVEERMQGDVEQWTERAGRADRED
jgi:ribonuclease HI